MRKRIVKHIRNGNAALIIPAIGVIAIIIYVAQLGGLP